MLGLHELHMFPKRASITLFHQFNRTIASSVTKILGIESSCDDSCAAIVTNEGHVLSSIRNSQHVLNKKNRGVIPFEAAQAHQQNLPIVVKKALEVAQINNVNQDITAVALTIGPGLAPCLGAGLDFAKYFCKQYNKPLILVNHMEGHALAPTMHNCVFYPAFGFMVSGGNTEIVYIPDHLHPFKVVGETVDDACGECIDKVYRYIAESISTNEAFSQLRQTVAKHGGAIVHEWATQYEATEECKNKSHTITFPLPMARQKSADYSFSGIKTYSLRYLEKMKKENAFTPSSIRRFCYYFEHALVKHLIHKLKYALTLFPEVHSICCGGGVMSNQLLQTRLKELGDEMNLKIYISPLEECTDNAIMIAWRGVQLWENHRSIVPVNALDTVRYDDKLKFMKYVF